MAALGAVILVRQDEGLSVVASEDPGVVHVHGLGVDPRDGTLYAATHLGLFRLPESGRPVRVADRYQDTMGFTVTGPQRFLASGHPELEDQRLRAPGKPPLLGLIESRDGGETWKSLSLLGEADFHALAAKHGRVYGFDSTGGRFMTSEDGRQWTEQSAAQLVSFAVSPGDAESIVAGTGTGMARSRDGGASWSPVESAPAVVFVSWDERGIWAATAGGSLSFSADGVAWEERGRLPGGKAEALLSDSGDLYVATPTGIHHSTDGGRTWRARYVNGR